MVLNLHKDAARHFPDAQRVDKKMAMSINLFTTHILCVILINTRRKCGVYYTLESLFFDKGAEGVQRMFLFPPISQAKGQGYTSYVLPI